jgi:hypothetical protein
MALILFGGKLGFSDVGEGAKVVAMALDGWLTLHVTAESAACVKALTERMQHCLQAKFTNPFLDVCVPSNLLPFELCVLSTEPLFRYGDKGFAAISRETLHLLRCCFTATQNAATEREALDSAAISSPSCGQSDGASDFFVDNEQPLHVPVFSRTYEIGGDVSGESVQA